MSTSEKTITYGEHAITVIRDMSDHVEKLARYYGEADIRYLKAAASHRRVMTQIVMAGFADTAHVSRDGALSLYVSEGTFVYGVIWHAVKRKCTVQGCDAYLNDDGTFYTYTPTAERKVCDGPHVPDYPLDYPAPGEWSMHS